MSNYAASHATVSEDKRYRYSLMRHWDPANYVSITWICLNPSKADVWLDDPSIRKMVGFSKRLGAGRMDVVNLFAYRATSPKDMLAADNPIGPENHGYLLAHLRGARQHGSRVIAAWGTHGHDTSMAMFVRDQARCLSWPLHCLAKTKSGAPGHPLYIPYEAPLQLWDRFDGPA